MPDQKLITKDAIAFIAGQLDLSPETIHINADLKSLGMDSFRIIELVLFLERNTGLSFPEHDYTPDNLKSIHSVVACFMKLRL